jgi:hypothetical protein
LALLGGIVARQALKLTILDQSEILEMALADGEKAAWESKANSVTARH